MEATQISSIRDRIENAPKKKLPREIIELSKKIRKEREQKEVKKVKKQKEKKINYSDFYKIADVSSHTEFESYLREIILKREEREKFYDNFLEIEPSLSIDSFKPYFELYSAERKTNQQDYTPESIAKILSMITRRDGEEYGNADFTAYDMTAGTGTLLINKWNDARVQETPWSYAPHRYFYYAEEMGDNSIPYLIHNLAIRGMNAIVAHGDSLHRKYKQIYFLQNSNDDFMTYSDVNVLPHSKEVEKIFNVREWTQEAIKHTESEKVVWHFALPMKAKQLEVSDDPPKYEVVHPWKEEPTLKDVAIVERAKKDKMYPEGAIIIQISATKGQVGQLKSDGSVGTQYVVICPNPFILTDDFLFYYLKLIVPWWFNRVQEGLNVKFQEIEKIPIMFPINIKPELRKIKYGQLSLF